MIRWWVMLHALDRSIPLRACIWPLICSVAVNNVFPLRAGDVLRVVGFRHALGAPGMRVLGTLILERLLDVGTLLVILAVTLVALPAGAVPKTLSWIAVGLTVALLVLLIGVFFGASLFAPSRLSGEQLAPDPPAGYWSHSDRLGRGTHRSFGTIAVARTCRNSYVAVVARLGFGRGDVCLRVDGFAQRRSFDRLLVRPRDWNACYDAPKHAGLSRNIRFFRHAGLSLVRCIAGQRRGVRPQRTRDIVGPHYCGGTWLSCSPWNGRPLSNRWPKTFA